MLLTIEMTPSLHWSTRGWKRTALHIGVFNRNIAVVETLHRAQIDVNIPNSNGDIATVQKNPETRLTDDQHYQQRWSIDSTSGLSVTSYGLDLGGGRPGPASLMSGWATHQPTWWSVR